LRPLPWKAVMLARVPPAAATLWDRAAGFLLVQDLRTRMYSAKQLATGTVTPPTERGEP
jgi:hypothetical protein